MRKGVARSLSKTGSKQRNFCKFLRFSCNFYQFFTTFRNFSTQLAHLIVKSPDFACAFVAKQHLVPDVVSNTCGVVSGAPTYEHAHFLQFFEIFFSILNTQLTNPHQLIWAILWVSKPILAVECVTSLVSSSYASFKPRTNPKHPQKIAENQGSAL